VVSEASRLQALTETGLLHPNPAVVSAPLFVSCADFFLAADKAQVKYEMLRQHVVDGRPVTEAARVHGYSRAAFYLVLSSLSRARAARRAAYGGTALGPAMPVVVARWVLPVPGVMATDCNIFARFCRVRCV
jgi:hypothetical protein